MGQGLTKIQQSGMELFQPVSEAVKLLHYVKEANYAKAEKIVKDNPQIMFEEVSINNHSEMISPLKLAFKLLDTYMWKKIFLEQIKNNPEMMKIFWKQGHEQKEHVNFESFFTAYDEYDALNTLHLQDLQDETVNNQLQQAWDNIGKAQREILPCHMLKEFLRSRSTWTVTSKFDVDELPYPSNVYARGKYRYGLLGNRIEEKIAVLPFNPNSGLSFEYTLENGGKVSGEMNVPDQINAYHNGCFGTQTGAISRTWRFDAAVFRHLYEVRIADFAKQMSLAPIAEQKVKSLN